MRECCCRKLVVMLCDPVRADRCHGAPLVPHCTCCGNECKRFANLVAGAPRPEDDVLWVTARVVNPARLEGERFLEAGERLCAAAMIQAKAEAACAALGSVGEWPMIIAV